MRNHQFTALLYGWIVVLGLILVSSMGLAVLLRFSSFSESATNWVTLVIGLISLFIGGAVAGGKSKHKGWMVGAITGLGFTVFVFLVQFLGYQVGFDLQQAIYHFFYILAALFGGAVGVNIASNNE
ncbi:TIGR04086 family membrane protein [Ornithinibacillus halotolerans]|uniref:Membrane protein YrzE n=1 Tax=Ornithinibacillus halotolerans TaxID=1274357 RepID=A0A916RSM5_9BACI|nr:TIGR04086 family membrane protein [Ornithinibacillus halotolerans]GGA69253.1 putative membrane protein YrzE [Ornithinibacillus halotolerans]